MLKEGRGQEDTQQQVHVGEEEGGQQRRWWKNEEEGGGEDEPSCELQLDSCLERCLWRRRLPLRDPPPTEPHSGLFLLPAAAWGAC